MIKLDLNGFIKVFKMTNKLFCFGMGYVGYNLSKNLLSESWEISGTCTSEIKKNKLQGEGFDAILFPNDINNNHLIKKISEATHILFSIPPDDLGDPVFNKFCKILTESQSLKWAAYLSSTGVYGNHSNLWVNEESKILTTNEKSLRRVVAESQWISIFNRNKFPIQIFRLSGIYGPGRDNFLTSDISYRNSRKIKINRVHLFDIIGIIKSSIKYKLFGEIFNVTDSLPLSREEILFVSSNLNSYKKIILEDNFFNDIINEGKKVSNEKVKSVLNYSYRYPDCIKYITEKLE